MPAYKSDFKLTLSAYFLKQRNHNDLHFQLKDEKGTNVMTLSLPRSTAYCKTQHYVLQCGLY